LSPTLFILTFNDILKKLKEKLHKNNNIISAFADDTKAIIRHKSYKKGLKITK
jgi:hypothetical protein